MSLTELRCLIAATDMIAAGALDITALEMTPSGEGSALSTAKITLTQFQGGAIEILPMQEIRVYEVNTTTGLINYVFFGGFIAIAETKMDGEEKIWTLQCQGYDRLLDDISLHNGIHGTFANTAFKAQMDRVVFLAQSGGPYTYQEIERDALIPNWFPTILLPHQSWTDATLRQMIEDVLALLLADPSVDQSTFRPRYQIIANPTTDPGAPPAALQFFNAAEGVTPVYRFSTRTSDILAGTHYPLLAPKSRKLDAAQLSTYRVGFGADGLRSSYEDTAALANYQNPYSSWRTWDGPPVENSQWEDQESTDAGIKQFVLNRSVPRESYSFLTWQRIRPGIFVSITDPLEGLVDYVVPVAEVSVVWITPDRPLFKITCGQRRLQLGEQPDDALLAPVVRDVVPPLPPTNMRTLEVLYEGASHSCIGHVAWDDLNNPNVRSYYVRWQTRSSTDGGITWGPYGDWHESAGIPGGVLDYRIDNLPVSTPSTLYLTHAQALAINLHGRRGGYSEPTEFTHAFADAPDPPTLTFQRDGFGGRGGAAWFAATITPPATLPHHYNVYYYPGSGDWLSFTTSPTATKVVIPVDVGVPYLLYLRSATEFGDLGLPSNTIVHTVLPSPSDQPDGPGGFDTTSAAAITTTNPGFTGWPTVAGTGAVSRNTSVKASGAASAAQTLTVGQGSTLTSTPFPTNDSARVVLRLNAQRTATSITPAIQVDSWDAGGSALTPLTPTLPAVAVGSWTPLTLKLDLPAGAVHATITLSAADGGISGTQTLYWSWGGWDVRKTVADTDFQPTDTDPLEGYNPATLEEAWQIYRSSVQKIVLAALNEATAGPNGLRLQDAYGNALDLGVLGLLLESVGAVKFNAPLAMKRTYLSGAATLNITDVLVVANMAAGDYTVTLPPTADVDGVVLPIFAYRDLADPVHTLTLQPVGSDTISGAADLEIDAVDWVILVADFAHSTWHPIKAGGGGGATAFTSLTDAPSSYSGAALDLVRVNAGATGLEFVAPSSVSDRFATKLKWENV